MPYKFSQGQYSQGQYAQGQFPQDQYSQNQFTQNQFLQNQYSSNQPSQDQVSPSVEINCVADGDIFDPSPNIYSPETVIPPSSYLAPPQQEYISSGTSSPLSCNSDLEPHGVVNGQYTLNNSSGQFPMFGPIPPSPASGSWNHGELPQDLKDCVLAVYNHCYGPGANFNIQDLEQLARKLHDTARAYLLEPPEGGDEETVVHNSESRYTCLVCSKGSYSRGTLKRHFQESHHHQYNYNCPQCDRYFYRKDKLRDHWKNNHQQEGNLSNPLIQAYQQTLPSPEQCDICSAEVHSWDEFFRCMLNHCVVRGGVRETSTIATRRPRDDPDDGANGFQFNPNQGFGGIQGLNYGNSGYQNQSEGGGAPYGSNYSGYCAKSRGVSDSGMEDSAQCGLAGSGDMSSDNKVNDSSLKTKSILRPDDKFLERITLSEPDATLQRKCKSCGHIMDGCTQCRVASAVDFKCHECADKTAQHVADCSGPVTRIGLESFANYADILGPKELHLALRAKLSSKHIDSQIQLEGDQASMFTAQRTKILDDNHVWGCDLEILMEILISSDRQLRVLKYFEQYLYASQKQGGFLGCVRETVTISEQRSFLISSAQDTGFQKVLLASDKCPSIPGEHLLYLTREKDYASFDAGLQTVRQAAAPKRRPHLRVRIRAIAGVLALRASISKTAPAKGNTDTDGCELGIPMPLFATQEDILKTVTWLIYLVVFLMRVDTHPRPHIYVMLGSGCWSVPSFTYPVLT